MIVALALLFSLTISNINEIWGWITMGIGAGMFIPQLTAGIGGVLMAMALQ